MPDRHYRKPAWVLQHVLNPAVAVMTRAGFSVLGSRVLEVRGRKSGLARRTPVSLLSLEGRLYLVSPRGETEWVRNVRAGGGRLDLLLGSRRQPYRAHEVPDADKVDVLRGYLRRWKAEAGVFFDGVGPDSTDEQIRGIARKHPVFRLETAA